MVKKEIQTHLVRKTAKSPLLCTLCTNKIESGQIYHSEEGVDEHLHSLLARRFCMECYAKHGEKHLLSPKE
jgi:hypothetical protein